jgi:hypothetical protein
MQCAENDVKYDHLKDLEGFLDKPLKVVHDGHDIPYTFANSMHALQVLFVPLIHSSLCYALFRIEIEVKFCLCWSNSHILCIFTLASSAMSLKEGLKQGAWCPYEGIFYQELIRVYCGYGKIIEDHKNRCEGVH